MSQVKSRSFAEARAMLASLELAAMDMRASGIDVAALAWPEFQERILSRFRDGTHLYTLGAYAVVDARRTLEVAVPAVEKKIGSTLLRPTLHANAASLLAPVAMSQHGFNEFADHLREDQLFVMRRPDNLPKLYWVDFDFDYYASEHTGCPAHFLPSSEVFPVVPGAENSVNFLEQFFHVAIDVALVNHQTT